MIRRSVACLLVAVSLLTPALAAPKKSTVAKKPAPKVESPASPGIAEPFAVAADDGPPSINAQSCIVIDARTGSVLHEKNADQLRPVASTQKLLTALIVAESGDLDESVTVRPSDTWAEPSKLYLKPGETYSRYKLLQILLVKSMNDVARCLARDNAGNIEGFAAKMNAKARLLGMVNSNFVNPNGLPASGQYSTARDMGKVAMAAYRNPIVRSIVRLKTLTWNYTDGRSRTFENTNRVLRNYALCNGMKTGYTEASGHCLISSGSHGGRDVIVVVLGDNKQVWNDSYRLLNWGLSS
ncbi:MAG TPA: D-alanyl-D-alanine carboxypeptidase family protein [Chthoniobacteraceae bacterium]|jgi:D-alanyl-D-alanine carboxypeptidase (penicillin-binding protein 5/6)|nr:D-alanyl-D-alanine carboxypeptidase family protein [Chthoniobacteraceae bacterium]